MANRRSLEERLRRYAAHLDDPSHGRSSSGTLPNRRSAGRRAGPGVAVIAAAVVLVVGGALFSAIRFRGSDSNPATAADRTDLGSDCLTSETDDPVFLPDYLGRNGQWEVRDAAALAVDRSEQRLNMPALRPDDGAERQQILAQSAPEDTRALVVVPDYLSSELETAASIPGTVVIYSSVGGDTSRDFATVRAIAHVDDTGDVRFVGSCADARLSKPLREFQAAKAPAASAFETLTALLSSDELRAEFNTFVYGGEPVAWVDRPTDERSVLDGDAPRVLVDSLRLVEIHLLDTSLWEDTNALVCTAIADVGMGECIRLRPNGPVFLDGWYDERGSVDLWILSEDQADRIRLLSLDVDILTTSDDDVIALRFVTDPPGDLAAIMESGDRQGVARDWLKVSTEPNA